MWGSRAVGPRLSLLSHPFCSHSLSHLLRGGLSRPLVMPSSPVLWPPL